jgi:putative toxin-antitoxin system antitoxin component (TIGR02293 family)
MESNLATVLQQAGIDNIDMPAEIVQATRSGVKKEVLDLVFDELHFGLSEMSKVLRVTPRTIQRYRKGQLLPPDTSDHLLHFLKVWTRATKVFEDEQKARMWLERASVALGGVSPLSLLDTLAGAEMVIDELGRIEHGIFA